MRCIMTDRHHRHMEHFIRRPAIRLAMLQGYQGDFGTLKGTALAMEALQELSIIPASIWSRSAATKWLLERQRDDGGWTEEPLTDGQDPSIGVGLTAHIMLALGRKGLGAIRMLECNNILSESNVHRLGKLAALCSTNICKCTREAYSCKDDLHVVKGIHYTCMLISAQKYFVA